MKITLESSPDRFHFPFRIIGYAGRYDTLSDCDFIDDTHIVCADRQMARLYLIQFDLEHDTYTIIDTATCICNNKPFHFELISIKSANMQNPYITIYAVSYTNELFSCNIVYNKFTKFTTMVVNPADNYHGVLALEDGSVYVTNMKQPTITQFNPKNGYKHTIKCSRGVRMKDVIVIDDPYIVALSSDRGPINGSKTADGTVQPINKPYDSHVILYNRYTGQHVCVHTLEKTQIDGCVYKAPFCYVTCTDVSGVGYILRLSIDLVARTFTDPVYIPCAGFPHGISIYNNMLAFTSYATSSLYIHNLSALV